LTTITMFDAVNVAALPPEADAYAGYVDGYWPTFPQLRGMFPGAQLLSIAVFASEDAECLDIENGDATIADAPGWHARQRARGAARPALYCSASNIGYLVAALNAARISRGQYRLWSAHYDVGPHICGPGSCGYILPDGRPIPQCDGTQFTDRALGRSLDQSMLAADFFTTPGDDMADSITVQLGAAAPPVTLPVWAGAAAVGAPNAFSYASLQLAATAAALAAVTFHPYTGPAVTIQAALTAGAAIAAVPPKPHTWNAISAVTLGRADGGEGAVTAVLTRW
jgi:hypothetical protein